MSGPLSNPYMFKSAAGAASFYDYEIANSIRMSNDNDSTLKITAGTPTSNKTFTYSWWMKKYTQDNNTTQDSNVFTAGTGGGTYVFFAFTGAGEGNDMSNFNFTGGGYGDTRLRTDMRFRDPASWYHCVMRFDSTQASSSNRVRLYVNGEEPTYDSASVQGAISQDEDFSFLNESGTVQSWGGISGVGTGQEGCDVYLANVVFCDGQSYGPDSFGETKNGVWIPKDPSGLTFGNNGYHLKFTNSSDLGEDFSGNDNDLTASGIATHDQTTDTPTNNFCTINPVYRGDQTADAKYGTLSEGDLKHSYSSSSDAQRPCTIKTPASGKWYFEYLINGGGGTGDYSPGAGIMDPNTYTMNGGNYNDTGSINYLNNTNTVRKSGSETGDYSGSRGSNGDVMGIAVDMDNGAFYVSKNGTFQTIDGGSQGDPTSGSSKTGAGATWTPASEFTSGMVPLSSPNGGSQPIITMNFGQDGTFAGQKTAGGNSDGNGYGNFFSAVPSGYLAICTANLSVAEEIDPAETDDNYPQKLFFMSKYTGNLTNRTITTESQPDLIVNRQSNYSQNWYTVDSTRGITANKYILWDTNGAEATFPQSNYTSVGSTSFGISSGTWLNSTGSHLKQWMWRANGGTTSSGSGDLTSTHQVDPSGGFSIVKATGDGGSSGDKTVTHGMSAAPDCILAKNLDSTFNWDTYWSSGLTSGYGLRLNTNDNELSGRWGTVNSSIFTCKYNYTWVGSDNFIYYCFRNIEGYIKVGKYVGNGEGSDGTFVYTGFKPAFLMIKRTDGSKSWLVQDSQRDPYNPVYHLLKPNSNAAEEAYTDGTDYNDFLSNGFKVARGGDAANFNNDGSTYVFLAMAHNPFKYATAR